MRSSIEWLRKMMQSFGFDIVRYPNDESLMPHLIRMFSALDINCVLDVGAHFGEYGNSLRMAGYNGNIVSFEPVTESFRLLLKRSALDPKWLALNYALGDREQAMALNVLEATACSSFLQTNEYASDFLGPWTRVKEREHVQVMRLDQLISEVTAGIDRPRIFLKMDTQGWDLEVLKGASGCLDSIFGLQSEVSVKPLYSGMPSYTEALPTYSRLGFQVTGLFAVGRDWNTRAIIELDCVMVRTGGLSRGNAESTSVAVGVPETVTRADLER